MWSKTVIGLPILVGFLLLAPVSFGDALSERLVDLRHQAGSDGKPPAIPAIIEQHETLLTEYKTPEATGRIYADLTEVLCNTGMKDPDAVIRSAKKALECPLDASVNMRVHVAYGDALVVKNRGATGEALEAVRGEIAKVYLEGIRVGLDNGVPDGTVPLASLGKLDISGDSPAVKQELKAHEETAAANETKRRLNELVERRETLESQIVSLYIREPHDTDGLKGLAKTVLKNDTAVQRLVAKTEARIKEIGAQKQR